MALKDVHFSRVTPVFQWIHWIWLLHLIQNFQCRATYWAAVEMLWVLQKRKLKLLPTVEGGRGGTWKKEKELKSKYLEIGKEGEGRHHARCGIENSGCWIPWTAHTCSWRQWLGWQQAQDVYKCVFPQNVTAFQRWCCRLHIHPHSKKKFGGEREQEECGSSSRKEIPNSANTQKSKRRNNKNSSWRFCWQ